ERQPGRIQLGGRIVISVAVANSGDRTPKLIVVLRIEDRDERVRAGDSDRPQQTRSVEYVQLLGGRDLTHHRVVDDRTWRQPETRRSVWRSVWGLLPYTLISL